MLKLHKLYIYMCIFLLIKRVRPLIFELRSCLCAKLHARSERRKYFRRRITYRLAREKLPARAHGATCILLVLAVYIIMPIISPDTQYTYVRPRKRCLSFSLTDNFGGPGIPRFYPLSRIHRRLIYCNSPADIN